MKSKVNFFATALICFSLFLSACNTQKPVTSSGDSSYSESEQSQSSSKEDKIVTSISISGSFKTNYVVGEQLDLTGLLITVYYSDDSITTINSGYDISPVDMSVPGDHEVVITYGGQSASFTIHIAQQVVMLDKKTALEKLASGPYQGGFAVEDNIGLSEPGIVGIDEDKLYNEELYPVPEKTADVHVYSAKDDIGMYYGAANNAGTLAAFISSIKNVQGIKIIEFEDIAYDIKSPIIISGIDDLYLVGKPNTIFLSETWGSYFIATSCHNLHLNNLQFDMVHSPTISGVITSVSDGDGYADITIKVPEEFDLAYQGYRNFDATNSGSGQCSYMECYLDEKTGRYVPDLSHNLFYNSATSFNNPGVTNLYFDGDLLTIRLNKGFAYCSYKTPVIGTHVSFAFTMYQNPGLSFDDCENLYLENLNIYTTGGMGCHLGGGKNIFINRTNYRCKEGSARIMTCTADIIHSVSIEEDLKITNCILEASHDDALNIKTWYCTISDVSKISSRLTIKQAGQKPDTKFDVGDIIELFDKETLQRMKSFEIIELEKNGSNYDVKVKGLNGAKVENNDVNYLVGNDTKATHMYLHNCLIQHKRNRGILLQARHSEISNCCFRNIVHGAIQVLGVRDIFGEAILPDNILIANNKFFNNSGHDIHLFSYGSSGRGAIGNIHHCQITNNYLNGSIDYAVRLSATDEIDVNNNLVYAIVKANNRIFSIDTSANARFRNNKYIITRGVTPDSLLTINGEIEGLIDENNTSEIFN